MRITAGIRSPEMMVACSTVFASFGQLSIKLGLGSGGIWSHRFLPGSSPATFGVVAGLFIYGLGTLLWMLAVSRREISYLYPLASVSYVLVALAGHFLLHEHLAIERWGGIAVMVGGIVLLTYAAPRKETGPCQQGYNA